MSTDNVEAFTRGLEAGNRGDIDALLDELHPEIEWHSALHALMAGQQTVFRGHDGVRTRNSGKASGAETVTPLALVTEIRDGKTIAIRAYLDRDKALEAAGLSE